MSNAAFTKLMIAQGLKRLLKTTSFVNVSVGDIARECQISRNTFYYHFKDKYDLISWIFYTEITSILTDDISLGHWCLCANTCRKTGIFTSTFWNFRGRTAFLSA